MADKKKEKKKNIFQRIAQHFKEVRQELKRVIWPSKEKLKNVSAVVLVCIVFFAIFLSIISLGGHWLLEKVHFYDQVEATTTVATEPTTPVSIETVVETEATEATEETSAEETEAAETTGDDASEEASNG